MLELIDAQRRENKVSGAKNFAVRKMPAFRGRREHETCRRLKISNGKSTLFLGSEGPCQFEYKVE